MGVGLEPAAEILLRGEEVFQGLVDRRVVAGEAGFEEGVDELAGGVDGARAGLGVALVPAAVGVLEGHQRAGLATDLVRVGLAVDQAPGDEAVDAVLERLNPAVGGAACGQGRDVGRGAGVVLAAGAAGQFGQHAPAFPGQAELALGGDDVALVLGHRVAAPPGGLEEGAEAIEGRGRDVGDLAVEVDEDGPLRAVHFQRRRDVAMPVQAGVAVERGGAVGDAVDHVEERILRMDRVAGATRGEGGLGGEARGVAAGAAEARLVEVGGADEAVPLARDLPQPGVARVQDVVQAGLDGLRRIIERGDVGRSRPQDVGGVVGVHAEVVRPLRERPHQVLGVPHALAVVDDLHRVLPDEVRLRPVVLHREDGQVGRDVAVDQVEGEGDEDGLLGIDVEAEPIQPGAAFLGVFEPVHVVGRAVDRAAEDEPVRRAPVVVGLGFQGVVGVVFGPGDEERQGGGPGVLANQPDAAAAVASGAIGDVDVRVAGVERLAQDEPARAAQLDLDAVVVRGGGDRDDQLAAAIRVEPRQGARPRPGRGQRKGRAERLRRAGVEAREQEPDQDEGATAQDGRPAPGLGANRMVEASHAAVPPPTIVGEVTRRGQAPRLRETDSGWSGVGCSRSRRTGRGRARRRGGSSCRGRARTSARR